MIEFFRTNFFDLVGLLTLLVSMIWFQFRQHYRIKTNEGTLGKVEDAFKEKCDEMKAIVAELDKRVDAQVLNATRSDVITEELVKTMKRIEDNTEASKTILIQIKAGIEK